MFRWQSMFKICDVHNKVPCHSSQRNLIYIPPLYIHQYGVSSAPIFWSYSKIRKWERQKKLWAKAHYTQASATTHRNHYAHYFIWGCVTHISISGGCSVECVFSPDDYTVSIFYYFSGDFFFVCAPRDTIRRATTVPLIPTARAVLVLGIQTRSVRTLVLPETQDDIFEYIYTYRINGLLKIVSVYADR